MVKARKYVVVKEFDGLPKREDFEIVENELPPIKNGEILVKVEWVSVDPYMRSYRPYPVPYDQGAYQVGLVIESKASKYPVGTRVLSHKGWCDYAIIDTNNPYSDSDIFPEFYKIPDLTGFPNSLAIGAVGMPGASGYLGFLDVCQPKAGETVVVTGAAGAVGSIVGQIAKIKGCKVIGFAGSDEKVKWLEEIGFDKAINYKTADIKTALQEAAPNGVDCFFDNVGGEVSSIIIYQMNQGGRVVVVGSISIYNDDYSNMPKVTMLQFAILSKQLKIQGFSIEDAEARKRQPDAHKQLLKWIKSGQLKAREHITEGFENLYDAFVGVLKGENIGKAVVKL
ncbi:prostaglandin reductase 1-like [Helicoverpa zea]|uniref:prostaglandin reductase 1-like n=1 Tax=Helicoverpa zea TaxID=7113 RepID=UPI001F59EED6|nr:prostaglandin reductase 1-like [Helicoverpa zea]